MRNADRPAKRPGMIALDHQEPLRLRLAHARPPFKTLHGRGLKTVSSKVIDVMLARSACNSGLR